MKPQNSFFSWLKSIFTGHQDPKNVPKRSRNISQSSLDWQEDYYMDDMGVARRKNPTRPSIQEDFDDYGDDAPPAEAIPLADAKAVPIKKVPKTTKKPESSAFEKQETSTNDPHQKTSRFHLIVFLITFILCVLLGVLFWKMKDDFMGAGIVPQKTSPDLIVQKIAPQFGNSTITDGTQTEFDSKLSAPLMDGLMDRSPQEAPNTTHPNTPSLPHAEEFDFQILEDKNLERSPLLPQKYAPSASENRFESSLGGQNSLGNQESYQNLSPQGKQKISNHLLPVWKKNALPLKDIDRQKTLIAMVLEYNPTTMPIENLPNIPATIAIDSDKATNDIVAKLRQKGYDVILNVPFSDDTEQNQEKFTNPIMAQMPYQEIEKRLGWHLSRVQGIIGIKNKVSSQIMSTSYIMNYVMNLLQKAQMTFLELNDGKNYYSIAHATASAVGIPSEKISYMFSDVQKDITLFLQKATYQKKIVASITATSENMALLSNEMMKLQGKPFQFVPLSTLYTINNLEIDK